VDGTQVSQAGGVAALVAVAALGAVTVLAGGGAPKVAAEPAGGAEAAFDPSELTLVATRHVLPSEHKWSAEAPVRIRMSDPEAAQKLAASASARLASGNGDQLAVSLTGIEPRASELIARVRVDDIPRAGEYAGSLSLDPLADKAATVKLSVKARHHLLWPFVVLMLGLGVGVGGTWLYERRRRQALLRAELTQTGRWLADARAPEGLHDLGAELVGRDPDADPAPQRCRPEAKPLPALYCRIRSTWRDLDACAEQVASLRARAELWYRAGTAINAMRAGEGAMGGNAQALVSEHDRDLVAELAMHVTEDDRPSVERLEAQAEVVEALALAWELHEKKGRPAGKDPFALYEHRGHPNARSAAVSRRLVGGLRGRQLELQQQQPLPPGTVAPPGPIALERRGLGLAFSDTAVFATHLLIAAVAFLLPVYAATSFGTPEQYLAVFAAGFLGKVVLDESLTLMRGAQA
jgi:hypothetical protein